MSRKHQVCHFQRTVKNELSANKVGYSYSRCRAFQILRDSKFSCCFSLAGWKNWHVCKTNNSPEIQSLNRAIFGNVVKLLPVSKLKGNCLATRSSNAAFCTLLYAFVKKNGNWRSLNTLNAGQNASARTKSKHHLNCVGEIWKRSFISAVRPTVHTNLSRKRSFISTVRPTVYTNPSRKRSFVSTVRPTVHTNPSRKRSFISTVRPTVHTNPLRKRSFSKTLFQPKTPENNGFTLIIWFPWLSFPKKQIPPA